MSRGGPRRAAGSRRAAAGCLLAALAIAPGCGREQAEAPASALSHRPAEVEALDFPEEVAAVTGRWKGDLDGMVERRLIRVAVARSGFFYYIRRGRQYGMSADMLQVFERWLNAGLELSGSRRIQVVAVPLTRDQLIPALRGGRVDLVVAGLTITEDRLDEVDFSVPWVTGVDEVVVTGPLAAPFETLDDLAGREVAVRVSSSYHESLLRLSRLLQRRGLAPIEIIPAHEVFEAEDLLEMVSVGMIPITVADDYIADFWSSVYDELEVRRDLVLREDGAIGWAFRKRSPELAALVNRFIEGHRQGTRTGNIILRRYLEHPGRVSNALSGDRLALLASEAPHFRDVADAQGLDWLRLAAQAYQESGLDNRKRSPSGAVGIMQVLPETARSMGVEDYASVEGNIQAGARYMRYLMDTWFDDPGISAMDRWLFALAAYNAGETRIARIREAAAEKGLDPDRWFDEVEREVERRVGAETVSYVRNVMKYYLAYQATFAREALRQEVLSRVREAAEAD